LKTDSVEMLDYLGWIDLRFWTSKNGKLDFFMVL